MDLPTFPNYQPFPDSGPLRTNLDISLDNLRVRLANHQRDQVYSYVMTSVRTRDGFYQQEGCGPNFQGGVLTICSCMHQMRTYDGAKAGLWVSGFTGVHGAREGNGLFYLSRIQDSARSQYALWEKLPPIVKLAKAAHLDPRGDLFEPRVVLEDPEGDEAYDVTNYKRPIPGHVHAQPDDPNHWYRDIDYVGSQTGRRQVFLIGEPEMTFIWTRPLIVYRGLNGKKHPRFKPLEMSRYLDLLRTIVRE
jgi:hypothetical protein